MKTKTSRYIETKVEPQFFEVRNGRIVNIEVPRHRGDFSLEEILPRIERAAGDDYEPLPVGTATWDRIWR